ncbi:MAG: flagellin, partial [Planctomycetota bacterium]
ISKEPGNESDPTYSGDGTRIAYLTQGGGVAVRDESGNLIRTLEATGTGATNPQLSHDGSLIAYEVGGNIRIRDTATGALADQFAGTDAHFSSDQGMILYESGANLIVEGLNAAGARTGIITTFANAANGQFSPTGGGNRVVFERGGDLWVAFADGSALTPLVNDDGSARTSAQVFATLPFAAVPNTLMDESFALTLIQDNDGLDVWSVVGSQSGAHTNYVAGTGLYTTDDTAMGGGGMSFELNPDGQYSVGDRIMLTTTKVAAGSLDDGPWALLEPETTQRLISGQGGTLDFRVGSYISDPSPVQQIIVRDGAQLKGGTMDADAIGFSVENVSSTFLGIADIDVHNLAPWVITPGDLYANALTVTQLPTLTQEDQPHREELVVISFTSPTTYDVWGSETGVKSTDNFYVSGSVIEIDGVELVLSGAAAARESYGYRVEKTPDIFQVRQAITYLTRLRGELGSIGQGIEKLVNAKEVQVTELTEELSRLEDINFAKEAAALFRNQVLHASAIKAVADSLMSRASLLTLLSGPAMRGPLLAE